MKKTTLRVALGAIACLGFGSTAVHAQAPQTCADLDFLPAITDRWPFANDTCLEIVQRDGKTFARFEAEVVSQSANATTVRYTLRDGGLTPARRANPPAGIEAVISGVPTAIKDLPVRQKVNVYLPDTSWRQPAPAPMAAAAPPPPPPPPAPEPEPAPMMPATAGNAGWLALMGGVLLLLGGALRFSRQRH